ncbi:sensor histidine kinase [Williamsia phyllosphaerae]|uniref:Sensor-like histidine kinase SenX3 n=1 Tax=Williamsia phyllosphaerae TaxID=885042 RepID=A0ABQ1UPU6_9NOCA|nr:ATP-binding protein [Williamsia phyllosphaerae]GGF22222.1 hypothetical protein GCM10007298_17680 [Williamsia phyllosphaerae]
MTAVIVAGVVVLIGIAGVLGWLIGKRTTRRSVRSPEILRATTTPAPRTVATPDAPIGVTADSTLGNRPNELLEPGTETVDGRMSKAALLALVVQTTEVGIAVVDEHRDVVMFNRRAHELGLVHDHLLEDQVWAASRTVLETGEDVDVELTPHHATNGFISTGRAVAPPVAVRCVIRLVTDGTERYAVVYGSDDSDNMRLEATRRDFVANVSHELKTPVGAIGLLTEALLESQDDPESVRHFGERVITESTRMGNMVNELIALSRLQGAERLPDSDDVDVDELVDEAIHRAQVGAEAAGISLNTDRPSGLVVRGDRTLLLTALNNLIANAIAYSPANSPVSVSRRVIPAGSDPAMVAIAVTDRGIGIAPRDQARVFERFFRVDKARSRATGGTGLGLAIVKHVAANHDGSITLWSKPGTGSTFTLAIPMSRAGVGEKTIPAPRFTTDKDSDRRVLETKELNR